MKLPAQIDGLENAVLPPQPLHLAIGMFDGVHRGHRAVVEPAIRAAREDGGISGVLTFWPHPSALLKPDNPTRLIQDVGSRARMLLALGVDAVITQAFTRELAGIPAEEFVGWLKRRLPFLTAIYIGENFRFGAERRGDLTVLRASGEQLGVKVQCATRVTWDGEAVSSTRIRSLIESGEIEAANALLGYNYCIEGLVHGGKQLGRTIGFPTLNVPWSPALRPRYGVYAVRASGEKSKAPIGGVANYGVRPTVEQTTAPQIEAHLFGGSPFGENDRVKIELLQFIRPERKFSGLDELKKQIAQDRDAAESILRARSVA